MSRDEFFSALFILGCLNGLGSRILSSVQSLGLSDALLATFGVSLIVWVACYQGIRLSLQEKSGVISFQDLTVGAAVLVLVSLPIGGASWLALTLLGSYVLLAGTPSCAQQRGAIILLAVTVPMLWSRMLFRYFANFILNVDASLIGIILRTGHSGNVVPFRDGSGSLMILPVCSSLANVSLAFLAWVTISNWQPHSRSLRDVYWCLLAGSGVIAVNVTRISLMGLNQHLYSVVHSQWGDIVTNLILMGLIFAICMLGVRSETRIHV